MLGLRGCIEALLGCVSPTIVTILTNKEPVVRGSDSSGNTYLIHSFFVSVVLIQQHPWAGQGQSSAVVLKAKRDGACPGIHGTRHCAFHGTSNEDSDQSTSEERRTQFCNLVHVPLSLGTVIFTIFSPIPSLKSFSTYPTNSLNKWTLSS
jgi:hypothetical protein